MNANNTVFGALASMSPGYFEVDVRKLLECFDEDYAAQQDASAIKGVIGEDLAMACLAHYFEHRPKPATAILMRHDKTGRRLPCTTGGKRRHELDGWLLVASSTPVAYQVEIKSWSFHSLGSDERRCLVENSDPAAALALKKEILRHYYHAGKRELLQPGVRKVLLKMVVPPELAQQPAFSNPQPLLCVWEPVCRHDALVAEAFFTVPVAALPEIIKADQTRCAGGGFDEVAVFSVSNYLREILAKAGLDNRNPHLRLHLPRVWSCLQHLLGILSLTAMQTPVAAGAAGQASNSTRHAA